MPAPCSTTSSIARSCWPARPWHSTTRSGRGATCSAPYSAARPRSASFARTTPPSSARPSTYASTLAVGNIAGEVLLFDTDPAARRHARAHAERVRDLRSGLQPRRQSPGCRLASARSGPLPTAYALSGDDRTVAIGGGRDANRARPQRLLAADRGPRQDALRRQPRRHGADLGSRRPPAPRAALHGAGRQRLRPPLLAELRRAPARAWVGRRRDQPRGHANADTA